MWLRTTATLKINLPNNPFAPSGHDEEGKALHGDCGPTENRSESKFRRRRDRSVRHGQECVRVFFVLQLFVQLPVIFVPRRSATIEAVCPRSPPARRLRCGLEFVVVLHLILRPQVRVTPHHQTRYFHERGGPDE